MTKQKTKTIKNKIKVAAFSSIVIAYAIGMSIVGLPEVELNTVLQMVYIGVGSSFFVWLVPKLF